MHLVENQPPLMAVVRRPSPVMVRGAGSYLWDEQGRRYLDFVQGWAANALGHAAPELVAALSQQASKLMTPSPAFHNENERALAQLLTELSGLDQAHFSGSGAEANEVAIKLARKWGRVHRQGAFEIISTEHGFHGRTLATMAASGKPGWERLFPPYPPGFVKVPYGNTSTVRHAIGDRTVAILVEPVQGEGGVNVPPPSYLAELRALADEHGLLLICDEIQTGIGRTGVLFAYQRAGVCPDILTLGKGLGGGVPIGATLATARAACFEPGEQGGTFNGNPLVTGVARTVLEVVLNSDLLANVEARGTQLARGLAELAARHGCPGARGMGLLQALVLPAAEAEHVRDACLARGLLVNAAQPTVLRFMPSLRVSAEEVDEAVALLDGVLTEPAARWRRAS